MDAFFAAIEQLDFPDFRGKPVVVGADPKGGKGRGVVSTCSYEARVYGIHSAMPISQAFKRCPFAFFVFPRLGRYSEMSKKIMTILEKFSPDIEPISIDEAFMDITTPCKIYGSPKNLALEIKKEIKSQTGLTASIGIAPTKFVAKIASDLEKPNGLVIVDENKVKEFLSPLAISRLWGVGKKTLPYLKKMGINTIGDMAHYSQSDLVKKMGKAGYFYWNLANGIDHRIIEHDIHAKSISKEVTFERDQDNEDYILETLQYLCNELAFEMRGKNYRGRTITLKIRLQDFSTFTRSRTMNNYVDHFEDLFNNIRELFTKFYKKNDKVRLIGVSVSQLQKGKGQLSLFEKEEKKDHRVDEVLDRIREKFGDNAITRASLIKNKRQSHWIRE